MSEGGETLPFFTPETMLIPSWIIVMLAFANASILGVWIWKFRTVTPLALMLPMIYIGVGYALFDQMDIVTARMYSRLGMGVLLFVLIFLLSAHYKRFADRMIKPPGRR